MLKSDWRSGIVLADGMAAAQHTIRCHHQHLPHQSIERRGRDQAWRVLQAQIGQLLVHFLHNPHLCRQRPRKIHHAHAYGTVNDFAAVFGLRLEGHPHKAQQQGQRKQRVDDKHIAPHDGLLAQRPKQPCAIGIETIEQWMVDQGQEYRPPPRLWRFGHPPFAALAPPPNQQGDPWQHQQAVGDAAVGRHFQHRVIVEQAQRQHIQIWQSA